MTYRELDFTDIIGDFAAKKARLFERSKLYVHKERGLHKP